MLAEVLPGEIFPYLLVFARIGAAVMLLPGFGERDVAPRIRLLFALALSVVIAPLVRPVLPVMPADIGPLFVLIGAEILIGLFIGGAARLLLGVMHMAGTVIGFHTGLAAAQFFDPAQGARGAIATRLLAILAIVLIFATNLHHVMLQGLVDSYTLFPPGAEPPLADFATMAAQVVAGGFRLAIQIAAPFMVVALMFYAGLGLLARLMPQMQVFFVAIPLQIVLGFTVFMLTLAAAMTWYLDYLETHLSGFTLPR